MSHLFLVKVAVEFYCDWRRELFIVDFYYIHSTFQQLICCTRKFPTRAKLLLVSTSKFKRWSCSSCPELTLALSEPALCWESHLRCTCATAAETSCQAWESWGKRCSFHSACLAASSAFNAVLAQVLRFLHWLHCRCFLLLLFQDVMPASLFKKEGKFAFWTSFMWELSLFCLLGCSCLCQPLGYLGQPWELGRSFKAVKLWAKQQGREASVLLSLKQNARTAGLLNLVGEWQEEHVLSLPTHS